MNCDESKKWFIYIVPAQRRFTTISLSPANRKHIKAPLAAASKRSMYTDPEGWKAEWTLAGKKVTQIFNPRPSRESNWGPQDCEADILATAPTPPQVEEWSDWSPLPPLSSVSETFFSSKLLGLMVMVGVRANLVWKRMFILLERSAKIYRYHKKSVNAKHFPN